MLTDPPQVDSSVGAVGPGRVLATVAIFSVGLAGCGSDAAEEVGTSIEAHTSATGITAPSSVAAGETTGGAGGETATWTIDPAQVVSPATTTLSVLVTRLGCASGVTGDVLEPVIITEADRVVITLSVVPLDPTLGYTCPTNDANSVRVQLNEPLGNRSLVDGACLGQSPERQTSQCETGAVRLQAPS
jgi:hypothetical protein